MVVFVKKVKNKILKIYLIFDVCIVVWQYTPNAQVGRHLSCPSVAGPLLPVVPRSNLKMHWRSLEQIDVVMWEDEQKFNMQCLELSEHVEKDCMIGCP